MILVAVVLINTAVFDDPCCNSVDQYCSSDVEENSPVRLGSTGNQYWSWQHWYNTGPGSTGTSVQAGCLCVCIRVG